MIFVLLMFAIGQFVLSQTLAGKNQALADLNAQIAQLAQTLSLAQDARITARGEGQGTFGLARQTSASERDDAREPRPRNSAPTSRA